jgi:hypothetical protein
MSDSRKPNFFIIGAPKCGTTSLTTALRSHSNIFIPRSFEPQFFCTDFPELIYLSQERYDELFADATDTHLAIGEKSVIYLYSEEAIPNILRFNPQARFIVMLRNPVELVYSWHSQVYNAFTEDIADFRKAWKAQDERAAGRNIPERCEVPLTLQYRELGLLGKYVGKFYELVPEQQRLTIFMDDFHTDTDNIYRQTLDFLGVPFEPRQDARLMNASKTYRSRWLAKALAHDSRTREARFFRKIFRQPGIRKLPLRHWLQELNKLTVKRKPLEQEFRNELLATFREDILELGRLTGRDLNHWLN